MRTWLPGGTALLGAIAALAVAVGPARASAGEDEGNAGLKALQAGDNDGAIAHFTRAIGSRQLHGDDLEFAYANRGQAYLNKTDYADAIADLDRARQLKPDDADAQNALNTALAAALPAQLVPNQSGATALKSIGVTFGNMLLQSLQQAAQQEQQQ